MNAHSKVNELEQFKAITHDLHFILCQNILSLDKSAIYSYITTVLNFLAMHLMFKSVAKL